MERGEAITRLKRSEQALRSLGASALFLFGSTARNAQNDKSDIDVFIDIAPGQPFTLLDLAAAQRLLSDSLSVPADLTTRDSLHPLLSRDVLADCIQVF